MDATACASTALVPVAPCAARDAAGCGGIVAGMAAHRIQAGGYQAMSDAILQFDDVDLGYGGRRVASAVRLAIPRGRWIALAGANGSGKTTLLRCAAGRLPPSRGMVRLDG